MKSGSKTEEVAGYSSNTAKKARLQSMLSALLDDPILSDVSKEPTLADVDTLISLELGSAMKVSVVKMDNTVYDVAVLNSATVADLKLAIMKKTNEIEQAQLGHRHISWRHIWANFCLSHENERLVDDNSLLSSCGIRNYSKVHFSPYVALRVVHKPSYVALRVVHKPSYVASRVVHKHSKRRKHRFFHGLSKRS